MTSPVWLITGCSSGFGEAIAREALTRGHQVIATARNVDALAPLQSEYGAQVKTLALDVTKPETIAQAMTEISRVDYLVNNAGGALVGALEEFSEAQMRANFELNFFGAVHMCRAVLPHMRAQGFGRIVNISAVAAISNEVGFGIYGAAKAALDGMSESLAKETAHLGIKVTTVCPGPFRTQFIAKGNMRPEHRIDAYAPSVGKFADFLASIHGKQTGDPAKGAKVIVDAATSETPPFRLVLGGYAYKKLRHKLETVEAEMEAWRSASLSTDFSSSSA